MSLRTKTLLYGILLIFIIGIGGFFYRNAVERPARPVDCLMDTKICPDGTLVGRIGPACEFSECPPL